MLKKTHVTYWIPLAWGCAGTVRMQATPLVSSDPQPRSARAWFNIGFIAITVLLNLFAVFAAWQDKSWAAMCIGAVGGPLANGVLALMGLIAIPFLRRSRAPFSIKRHLALALGLPMGAAVIDAVVIFSMK